MIKWFRGFLMILWRVWFYFMMAWPILLLFPILLILTSRDRWYPYFYKIARVWSLVVLYGSGFYLRIEYRFTPDPKKSYMFIANHTSMADIMMMFYAARHPFVFVGKKELQSIPIFGFFYKRASILVDRGDAKSRQAVFARAQQRLQSGLSICIFPEGLVPDDMSIVLDEFKDGAFRLAIEHQIPVVPMVFFDNKRRFPYVFFKGKPGLLRAIVFPEIPTQGLELKDKRQLRRSSREVILNALLQDQA